MRAQAHQKNRMHIPSQSSLSDLEAFLPRIHDFIQRAHAHSPTRTFDCPSAAALDAEFNTVACELFRHQVQSNPAYAAFCKNRGQAIEQVLNWRQIPAIPTHAFKELEVTSLPSAMRGRVFHSSGTTEQRPSRHFHSPASLELYEASLLPWFESHLLSDFEALVDQQLLGPLDRPGMIFLIPDPEQTPHSSLAHMMGAVRDRFASVDSFFAGQLSASGEWLLDMDRLLFALRKSMCSNRPLWILGTAFNFVHLLDHFQSHSIRYRLATGSRVMETGGYKGRSRELSKSELHAGIGGRLGIGPSHIVCEYGMSELSSQAYDLRVGEGHGELETASRRFRFPPWARVRLISPETGNEVSDGHVGLIEIVDLANAFSAMAIRTEDLGRRDGDAFELLGRANQAESRGCSLMSLGEERSRKQLR